MTTPPLPEQIELHPDRMWRRDEDLRIESAVEAERFIEDEGFANTLTDAHRMGMMGSGLRFCDSQLVLNRSQACFIDAILCDSPGTPTV